MSINKIRTIFIGTPDFAVPGFKALLKNNSFEIMAVITQPDKKTGRKQTLSSPPVKKEAEKNNIKVWQPYKITEIVPQIKKLNPDLIVVVAYGQLIPKSILDIPKFGCFNVHASLLPKYRGAAAIQAPLLNGDKKTGVTIMKMDSGLDTGPVLKQTEIEISPNETASTLHDKLAQSGANILAQSLLDYINNKTKPKKQEEEKAIYVSQLKKEDGLINWQNSAEKIERMVRALSPWPGTYTKYKQKTLKILEIESIIEINNRTAGEVFLFNQKMAIQCGQDSLLIARLQLEGAKEMPASDFLKGRPDIEGTILG